MTAPSLTFRTGLLFWKQPTFLASLVSIGLHGLVFAVLDLTPPASSETEEVLQSIEVVELSPAELQRLPDFALPTAPATPAFSLPTSELPSLANISQDLEALAQLGSNAIAQAPPGPSGSPLPQYNWSNWLPPPPQTLPAPAALPPIQPGRPIALPQPLNPAAPPVEPWSPTPPAPSTPANSPNPSPPPNSSGSPPVSTSARDLLPNANTAPTTSAPPQPPADPYAALRDRYSRHSVGATDPGSALGVFSDLTGGRWSGVPINNSRPENVSLAFPDAVCPEDASVAGVAVKVSPAGVAEEVEVYLETGYSALDEDTRLYFRRKSYPAADSAKIYQYGVTYEDQGGCEVWVNRNGPAS